MDATNLPMTGRQACLDAFLLYKARRNDLKGKKILTVNEKYYCADHGMRAAALNRGQRDISETLENIVYLELLRRNFAVTVGKAGSKEIDFVAEKDGRVLYVQVAYLLASEETIEREFGGVWRFTGNQGQPSQTRALDGRS